MGGLAFQPEMTATAANVAYGWLGHDIGGHCEGIEDPKPPVTVGPNLAFLAQSSGCILPIMNSSIGVPGRLEKMS